MEAESDGTERMIVQLHILMPKRQDSDPEWVVTKQSPFYSSILTQLEELDGGTLPSVPGYKGFVVTVESEGGTDNPTQYTVPRGSDSILENLLLDTAQPSESQTDDYHVTNAAIDAARAQINDEGGTVTH